MFIEILFKILLFKGGVLIYAEHCMLVGCQVDSGCEDWYFFNLKHVWPCVLLQNTIP